MGKFISRLAVLAFVINLVAATELDLELKLDEVFSAHIARFYGFHAPPYGYLKLNSVEASLGGELRRPSNKTGC